MRLFNKKKTKYENDVGREKEKMELSQFHLGVIGAVLSYVTLVLSICEKCGVKSCVLKMCNLIIVIIVYALIFLWKNQKFIKKEKSETMSELIKLISYISIFGYLCNAFIDLFPDEYTKNINKLVMILLLCLPPLYVTSKQK